MFASTLPGTNPLNRTRLDMSMFADLPIKSFVRLHCGGIGVDLDTTWNEMHTSSAARMAAGCVIDLSFKGRCLVATLILWSYIRRNVTFKV